DAVAAAVATARSVVAQGHLVTFGIDPEQPETGYGYIKRGAALPQIAGAYAVQRFVEKPDLATAKAYLAEGGWAWNSGMFLFDAATFLAELKRFEPLIAEHAAVAANAASRDLDFVRLDKAAFAQSPAKSIDYAVMERTDHSAVVPARLGWSDVGAWNALWELGPRDDHGNVLMGDVAVADTQNSYLRSEH
ncbi:MAG: sugar phosphate nucleotidyltransferase, partial [Rhodospirillales bacterium]